MSFAQRVYALTPGFNEAAARQVFESATKLKTMAAYCPDPRAADIPAKIAAEFKSKWPGTIARDEQGDRVALDTELVRGVTADGRAVDTLRTVNSLGPLLGLESVVVVHHTFCRKSPVAPKAVMCAS